MDDVKYCIPVRAFNDNYIWLITNKHNNNTIIVDPGDAQVVVNAIKKYDLAPIAIFLTHHHTDHSAGIPWLVKKYSIPVYGSQQSDKSYIKYRLNDADIFYLQAIGMRFEILTVPGHTLDHIAFYNGECLFCGDTLFLGGCGRLFEGTAEQMYKSLAKIAALPDDTVIFCAHEYTLANLMFAQKVEPDNEHISTELINVIAARKQNKITVPGSLKREKQVNPFLRCAMDSVKLSAEQQVKKILPSAVDVFAVIREWKDHFTFSEKEFLYHAS